MDAKHVRPIHSNHSGASVDDRYRVGRPAAKGTAVPRARFTDDDVMDWVRRREAGESLRNIAAEYGVSTQYVSMVTNHQQRRPWPTADERPKPELDALVEQINAWLRERTTTTTDEVKQEFDLTSHQWNQIWKRLDNSKFVGKLKFTSRVEKYDDGSCKAALREVFEANGKRPLTGVVYERLRDRDRHPSVPTIHNRFGSWSAACGAAEVPFGGSRRDVVGHAPTRGWSSWSDDEILGWIRAYRESLESTERPSYNGYDNWQRTQQNAPSGSLVRVRLKHLGNWGDILAAAAQDPSSVVGEEEPDVDAGSDVPVNWSAGNDDDCKPSDATAQSDADLLALLANDEGVSDAEITGFFDTMAADTHEFIAWPVDVSRCLYCGESPSSNRHPRRRRCPSCGSTDLQDIVYIRGLPAAWLLENRPPNVRFAGCSFETFQPNVCCQACDTEFSEEDGVAVTREEYDRAWIGLSFGSFGPARPTSATGAGASPDLTDLSRIAAKLTDAQSNVRGLTAERDELITDLLDQRVATGDEVGAIVGLSQPRTSQIRQRITALRTRGTGVERRSALTALAGGSEGLVAGRRRRQGDGLPTARSEHPDRAQVRPR